MKMQHLQMHTSNQKCANAAKLKTAFPECVTESVDENGNKVFAIDFDRLRLELNGEITEHHRERYTLDWPGKQQAILLANTPITKTLRPSPRNGDSIDFDKTQNLFLEGDNLDALKILQESYLGKIQLIYIDPPYNTGNDFVYNDSFKKSSAKYLQESNQIDESGNRLHSNTAANGRFHSDWLSMIYPRLRLAKNLLRNDGIILVSIDDNEQHNLRKLCDEIFGPSSFVGVFAWRARTAKADVPFGVSNDMEWIVAYGMPSFIAGRPGERKYFKSDDHADRWRLQDLTKNTTKAERPNSYFTMINPKTGEKYPASENRTWSVTTETFPDYYKQGKIVFPGDYDFLNIRRPAFRVFEAEDKEKALRKYGTTEVRMPISTFLPEGEVGRTEHGTKEIRELFGAPVFSYPKPSTLIQYFIENCSPPDAIIMDFFAGSGTTAQAVLQQNAKDGGERRFILVQLPEPLSKESAPQKAASDFCVTAGLALNICEITKERIRRVGKQLLQKKHHPDWNKDVGFRVLKIDTSNMADIYYTPDALDKAHLDLFVENIKSDRTSEDLLFQVMLDWGVDLALPIDKQMILSKEVFFVDGNALAACFDAQGGVDEAFVKELARLQPLRVVFRDASFQNDAVKINVEQIFRLLSPATEVKCI